jgi:hypothetical protein
MGFGEVDRIDVEAFAHEDEMSCPCGLERRFVAISGFDAPRDLVEVADGLGLHGPAAWLRANDVAATLAAVLFMLLASTGAFFLVRRVLLRALTQLSKQAKTSWDDLLVDQELLHRISWSVPWMTAYELVERIPHASGDAVQAFQRLAIGALVLVTLRSMAAFLRIVETVYSRYPSARNRPIKGDLQILMIGRPAHLPGPQRSRPGQIRCASRQPEHALIASGFRGGDDGRQHPRLGRRGPPSGCHVRGDRAFLDNAFRSSTIRLVRPRTVSRSPGRLPGKCGQRCRPETCEVGDPGQGHGMDEDIRDPARNIVSNARRIGSAFAGRTKELSEAALHEAAPAGGLAGLGVLVAGIGGVLLLVAPVVPWRNRQLRRRMLAFSGLYIAAGGAAAAFGGLTARDAIRARARDAANEVKRGTEAIKDEVEREMQ